MKCDGFAHPRTGGQDAPLNRQESRISEPKRPGAKPGHLLAATGAPGGQRQGAGENETQRHVGPCRVVATYEPEETGC